MLYQLGHTDGHITFPEGSEREARRAGEGVWERSGNFYVQTGPTFDSN